GKARRCRHGVASKSDYLEVSERGRAHRIPCILWEERSDADRLLSAPKLRTEIRAIRMFLVSAGDANLPFHIRWLQGLEVRGELSCWNQTDRKTQFGP